MCDEGCLACVCMCVCVLNVCVCVCACVSVVKDVMGLCCSEGLCLVGDVMCVLQGVCNGGCVCGCVYIQEVRQGDVWVKNKRNGGCVCGCVYIHRYDG